MLNDIHSTVNDIRGRVDIALDSITKTVNYADGLIVGVGPNVHKIAKDGGEITGQIHTLVTVLNAGKRPTGLLLKDGSNQETIAIDADECLTRFYQLGSSNCESDHRGLSELHLSARTDATLDNLQSMSQNLNDTVKEALARHGIGQNGAANMREKLSNVNRSTANLADDTEALKHNFLFGVSSRSAASFSLEQLTPDEYAKACER